MTVTISAKHDVSMSDDNDNETCCSDKKDCDEQTNNLLKEFIRKPCPEDNTKEKKENDRNHKLCHERAKKLFTFKEAPDYIKHNTFILSGYRGILDTHLCLESIFWWTNETINIWSHIFGFVLFLAVTIRDVWSLDVYAFIGDKLIVGFVLICFQVCMFLSALYHTFSCRSERDCDFFLSFDLFGIALSLLAIYTSGIYYAFWCNPGLLNFYIFTVTIIFAIAMLLHVPRFNVGPNVRMMVFVGWAAYGVVPTLHWAMHMGWFEHPLVCLLLPRVVGMYLISGTAFAVYITKVPERFCSGKFDYLGHSHQWWHLFVVAALYYWHCTGMIYLEYRFNHACASHMTLM
ncbi:progestin and adipoQ receptor family member 3 [Tribolium madens]|uniref:progestin and adipoQ receptor family member 3 n=1 Tax=Tribolium madens TaxID=41895 RepID=UPI001CF76385|nr:progestin and adipoQ receptor family member 3 [Tribolium madens]XP_044258561.1 progestin and adipoQ receptor family member 3 [Tribolium madens]